MNEVRVAIIGWGGIARVHYSEYCRLYAQGVPVSVVAVFDKNPEQFRKNISINLGDTNVALTDSVHQYTDLDEMLRHEDFDMADVCLPTFLHCEYTVKLLEAGKHVLCEKPMALSHSDCQRMLTAAHKNDRRLMIGHCLRFSPFYLYLKECIDTGRFGKLRHMTMERLSEYPTWGSGWFNDKTKCGGCVIDTHIHDVDIARFFLGEPRSVSCITYDDIPHCQLASSRLFYDETTVLIEGAWDETLPVSFQQGYNAKFEHASVVYDGASVKIFPHDGDAYVLDIVATESIGGEIELMTKLILHPEMENTVNSPRSSAKSIQLVELLSKSGENGGIKYDFNKEE